jgi:serine acetyltransferase
MSLARELLKDALSLAKGRGGVTATSLLYVLFYDGYAVLATMRLRQAARRWHIPFVNRTLRLAQMALYNIEIAKDVQLGEGVHFMHSMGTVVGGDAKIGDRVHFLGGITVGNLDNRGYPTIGEDVLIGAGARILGPITIGAGARIGANAVVTTDVPPGATAVGIPAVVKLRRTNDQGGKSTFE